MRRTASRSKRAEMIDDRESCARNKCDTGGLVKPAAASEVGAVRAHSICCDA